MPSGDLVLGRGGDALELGSVRDRICPHAGAHAGQPVLPRERPDDAGRPPGQRPAPALVAGDTLFVQGCGRVDLPGSDPDEMYRTLTQRLAKLPPTTVLFPGHDYGPTPTSTLERERATNPSLRLDSLEAWRRVME